MIVLSNVITRGIYMDFADALKKLRKSKGYSIRQLALYSGVSAGFLSQVENKKRGIPSPDVLKKLYKPLGITYEEIMRLAGYMDNDKVNESIATYGLDEDIEKLLSDPEFMIAYKEMPGTPEEAKEELIRFMKYLKYEEEKKKKK
jgi:transcriptional regulator with XRE-family HTH domain